MKKSHKKKTLIGYAHTWWESEFKNINYLIDVPFIASKTKKNSQSSYERKVRVTIEEI